VFNARRAEQQCLGAEPHLLEANMGVLGSSAIARPQAQSQRENPLNR